MTTESFFLRNQSAQTQGRYDLIRDIHRLELMRSQLKQCKAGYAVLLTNDSSYWKVSARRDTVDADFRIHDGRAVSGVLAWANSAKPRNCERPRITDRDTRLLFVFVGSSIPASPGKSYGSFRYLSVSVE